MATNRLSVTELDFDQIKINLKNFLRSQSEFQDYDFDGSGLSVLIDILAYNTHYNAYYLNMIANESFLDSALLRSSVVSHAKTLGYIPFSRKSARAVINMSVLTTGNTSPGVLTLTRSNTIFKTVSTDFTSYNFSLLEDVTVSKTNDQFLFENLEIYEGQNIKYAYVHDETNNPKAIYRLPDKNVDLSTLKVTIQSSIGNTSTSVYNSASDVLGVDSTSEVYFIQEGILGFYEVYFGDGVIGKKLNDGCVVYLDYLVSSGSNANDIDLFVLSTEDGGYNNFNVSTVSASSGGSDKEEIDSIKFLAPTQFVAQNRLLTVNDYTSYLKKNYPNVDSISVWGGEDEVPPAFGKVFVSLKPKQNYYISENEKQRIIDEIISPKSMMSIKTEIIEPDYVYLTTLSSVQYRRERTTYSPDGLKSAIRQAILNYKNINLDKFGVQFVSSKLQEQIHSVEYNSIIGCETVIRIQKRITPTLNRVSNYLINFNIPLLQGSPTNKLSTTEFDVFDISGVRRTVTVEEVPKSFTGINAIDIIDSGVNYTTTPTVTITGDGQGATAKAILNLGRIERIEITNPGIDYNKAIVTITGGGGSGAVAVAVIDTSIGTLRTVYYDSNSERQIVNSNAGTIDYTNGTIELNDINILSTSTTDGQIRINCGTQSSLIQSTRNTILTIDETDASAITVNLQTVRW